MKLLRHGRILGGLAAVGLLLGAAASAPVEGVAVGAQVAYTFRSAPLNGMGVSSLADLRGKPVLVEFWGTR